MPAVAVFLSRGGLGDCAQHAVAHALARPDVKVHAIMREASVIGHIDKEKTPFMTSEQLASPQLEQHVIDFTADHDGAEVAQLQAVLAQVDTVIAAPCDREYKDKQPIAERSMRAICAALQHCNASDKRLVFVSAVATDKKRIPWTPLSYARVMWYALTAGYVGKPSNMDKIGPDFVAAEAIVRASGLDYLIARPMALNPACQGRNKWRTAPLDDAKARLGPFIAKEDMGRFLLHEALQLSLHRAEVHVSW